MSKKEKTIYLITESFEESALEILQGLEPGPVYLVSGETPDGMGIYLCDQPFTLQEAEKQHLDEEPVIDDPDEDFTTVPLDEVEEDGPEDYPDDD